MTIKFENKEWFDAWFSEYCNKEAMFTFIRTLSNGIVYTKVTLISKYAINGIKICQGELNSEN